MYTIVSVCMSRKKKKKTRRHRRFTIVPGAPRVTHTHMHYSSSLRLLVFFTHIHTCNRPSHLHTRTLSRSGGSMYTSEKKKENFNDSIEARNTTPCSSGEIVSFLCYFFHFSLYHITNIRSFLLECSDKHGARNQTRSHTIRDNNVYNDSSVITPVARSLGMLKKRHQLG